MDHLVANRILKSFRYAECGVEIIPNSDDYGATLYIGSDGSMKYFLFLSRRGPNESDILGPFERIDTALSEAREFLKVVYGREDDVVLNNADRTALQRVQGWAADGQYRRALRASSEPWRNALWRSPPIQRSPSHIAAAACQTRYIPFVTGE
jgi:hypothetical protein